MRMNLPEILLKGPEMAEMEAKRIELLKKNKAAARVLLLGVFSESKEAIKRIERNYEPIE